MEYVRLSKSRGFKYACNSHLYSQHSKKKGVMYLKYDRADCKGTAKIDQGLLVLYTQIPRGPIYCQNPLLAHSTYVTFTAKFHCLQIQLLANSYNSLHAVIMSSCRFGFKTVIQFRDSMIFFVQKILLMDGITGLAMDCKKNLPGTQSY